MRRLLFVSLLVVALAAGVLITVQSQQPPRTVYSSAQVKAGLVRNPKAWVGRTVLVRGLLIDTSQTVFKVPYVVLVPPISRQVQHGFLTRSQVARLLIFAFAFRGIQVLRLRTLPPSPFIAFFRSLPFVDQVVPSAPKANTLSPAVYRVQLLPPRRDCGRVLSQRVCYDALLSDYQPGKGP